MLICDVVIVIRAEAMNRKENAILWCLRHQPGMRGPELCEVTGIWRTSIYVYLGRLEGRGLVRHEVTAHPKFPIEVHRYYAIDTEVKS